MGGPVLSVLESCFLRQPAGPCPRPHGDSPSPPSLLVLAGQGKPVRASSFRDSLCEFKGENPVKS